MASFSRWTEEVCWSLCNWIYKGYLQKQLKQHELLCHIIVFENYLKTIKDCSKMKVLNKNQCVHLLEKLIQSMKGICAMLAIATENLQLKFAFEEIHSLGEKVEMVVKSCVEHVEWRRAFVFQLQNKETFRELLLDLECCYKASRDMFSSLHPSKSHEIENIQFDASTIDEVDDDVTSMKERLQRLKREGVSEEVEFAQHLLLRLRYINRVDGGDLADLEVPPGFKIPTFCKEIGSGSFGKVQKSEWMGLECATKVLEGDLNVQEEHRREIGILAGLSHPNLIQFFDCGTSRKRGVEGTHKTYMVMELMNGSLSNILKEREEPLPYYVAIDIMHQIAKGMHYLHDMQVAHLDLKPDNILCDAMTMKKFGRLICKVTDYGTSVLEVCTKPKDQQPSKHTIGTPSYMAPEMDTKNSTSLHPFHADVWSFAMTCSEVLSRKQPFPGLSFKDICDGISSHGSKFKPDLPNNCEELTDLIQECWADHPIQRPTFSMICERLARIKEKFLKGEYSYNAVPKYGTVKSKRDSKNVDSHAMKEDESMPNHNGGKVGIENQVTKAKMLLKMKYVGIVGMGGIGKTTLAKAIFDDEMANPSYDASSFIVECKNHQGSYDILCKILPQFGNAQRPRDLEDAQKMMKELYNKKKVLLILDDVKGQDQVEEIAPPNVVQGSNGTTIVLTTRDKKIVEPYVKKTEMLEVGILDEASAMKLFDLHQRGKEEWCSSKALDDLRERVVRACNGLPLSLKVMGKYLRGKSKLRSWERALKRMKRGKSLGGDEEVWNTLEVSYDGLSNNLEKRMFLDMACFFCQDVYPKGICEDEALDIWSENNIRPICELERLIELSMLTLDGSKKYLKMHDQLRDMGRRIAKGTRIWKGSMIFDSGLSSKVCERLEGISWRGPLSHVDSFREEVYDMRNLRILIIQSNGCNSSETRHNLELLSSIATKSQGLKCLKITKSDNALLPEKMWDLTSLVTLDLIKFSCLASLPEGVANLTSLTTLRLSRCESLATLSEGVGNLTSLTTLDLSLCKTLATLPEGVGNLTSLTTLDLSVCKTLATLPEGVGNLTSLTTLNLSWCNSLLALPEEVGNLTSLTTLDLSGCKTLVALPKGVGNLTSLTTFDLSECHSLLALPEGVGNLTSLTTLNLSWCNSLLALPEEVGNLTSLTTLDLSGCKRLVALPKGVGNLTSLTTLHLSQSESLAALLEEVGTLTSLTTLSLSQCESLAALPEGVGNLTSLTTLRLLECRRLAALPEGVGNLTSLITLDLSECRRLAALPEGVGNLTSLTTLDLSGCKRLVALPKGVGNLTSLTTLDLSECRRLAALPEGVGNLTSLTTLDLSWCNSLLALPEEVGNLTSLTTFCLSWCESLAALPEEMGNLTSLTTLRLSGCKSLAALPKGVGNLISLTTLDLLGCKSLAALPEGVRNLTSLTTLHLSRSESLAALLEEVGTLSSLTTLSLSQCESLAALPEGVGNLTSLTTLRLARCESLAALPKGVGNLTSLTTLDLSWCKSLVALPEGVWNLTSLTFLDLLGCKSLAALPEEVGNLASLTALKLSDCERLAALPEEVGNLTSLTTLVLSGCRSLAALPEGVENLTSLTTLVLSLCERLASLPERVGNLTSLTILNLSGCKSLAALPEGVGNLASLTFLDLSGCKSLAALPEGVGNLASLTFFDLSGCTSLAALPEGVGNLASLTFFDLSGCTSLVALSERVGNLTSLESLRLSGCKSLAALPEGVGKLASLTTLELSGCKSLAALPERVGNLTSLETLALSGCKSLAVLPEGVGNLTSLETLDLSWCERLAALPEGVGNLTSLTTLVLSGCKSLAALPERVENLTSLTIFD